MEPRKWKKKRNVIQYYTLDLPGLCGADFAFSLTTDPNLQTVSRISRPREIYTLLLLHPHPQSVYAVSKPWSRSQSLAFFSLSLSTFRPFHFLSLSRKVLNSVLPHWLDSFLPFFTTSFKASWRRRRLVYRTPSFFSLSTVQPAGPQQQPTLLSLALLHTHIQKTGQDGQKVVVGYFLATR